MEASSGGCADRGCTNKDGCDSRKQGMFEAIDQALERLYPTRQWNERDDAAALGVGVPSEAGLRLARLAADRLRTAALHREGGPDESCDWVYIQCGAASVHPRGA